MAMLDLLVKAYAFNQQAEGHGKFPGQ